MPTNGTTEGRKSGCALAFTLIFSVLSVSSVVNLFYFHRSYH